MQLLHIQTQTIMITQLSIPSSAFYSRFQAAAIFEGLGLGERDDSYNSSRAWPKKKRKPLEDLANDNSQFFTKFNQPRNKQLFYVRLNNMKQWKLLSTASQPNDHLGQLFILDLIFFSFIRIFLGFFLNRIADDRNPHWLQQSLLFNRL